MPVMQDLLLYTSMQVNGGSLAEKAGLCVGDNLIRVNSTDIYQMRHKEAQDNISKAGNNFELVVSRSLIQFFNRVKFSQCSGRFMN